MKLTDQFTVFFLSTLSVIILILFKVPVVNLDQIIISLILILLLILRRSIFSPSHKGVAVYLKLFLLFLCTLFVQLTVISSGAIYSPFLIVFYLFALGLSFLVDFKAALLFFIFSFILLISTLFLQPTLRQIFTQDPATPILYLVSYLTIIPLSQLLAEHYRLKDKISKILFKQINIQQSILAGLNELVFVTDLNLHILAINHAVENNFAVSQTQVENKDLLNIIFLKDIKNSLIDRYSLSIDRIIAEKTARMLPNLLLHFKNSTIPQLVSLTIRPVINAEGEVDQLVFIISPSQIIDENSEFSKIDFALIRYYALGQELQKQLSSSPHLAFQVEMLKKMGEDIINFEELKHQHLNKGSKLADLAQLCQRIITAKQNWAQMIKVPLQFHYIDFGEKEVSVHIPKNLAGLFVTPDALTSSVFTAPISIKWTDILLQKLLEIVILLSSSILSPKANLTIKKIEGAVLITISAITQTLSSEDQTDLFKINYGRLANKSNLFLGSGVEGAIAQLISEQLEMPISVTFDQRYSTLSFLLKIITSPQPTM